MSPVTIHRHKDGSLAIEEAPELFICSRASLQTIIDSNNGARSEITRLEDELAKASGLQQTVTIASQTIKDQHATIERLNTALRNASAIYDVATKQRDEAATLAGELIAAIRINAMRGTFATAAPEQVDEWLQPFIQRLNTTKP